MKAVIAAVLAAGVAFAGSVSAGEAEYKKACAACHDLGVSGAPKLGDKAAWAPRIAKGMPALYETALKGKPGTAMMPKGGSQLDEAALKSTVDYMVSKAK
ncbi:MAG TPA: c-type cytochrome [Azonexus sp.]